MQQILKVDIDWETLGKLRDLSDDDYIALRDALELPELPPLDAKDTAYFTDGLLCSVNDIATFTRFGIAPRISRVRGIFQESLTQLGVPEPQPGQPQIVNIAIPNASLFAVQTLQVIENECTNYVQMWLDKGWRIVAVCPPNDCRRPTFILGHADRNPERP